LSTGTAGRVPADTPTLKSVEVRSGRLRSERDSTLGTARSSLYIEVGECGVYEIGGSVIASERFAGTCRETLQFL